MMACMLTACTKQKVLVLYYSQTGTTQALAEELQRQLGADIEQIEAVVPYDGDFGATIERSGKERESGVVPEIKPVQANLADYDVIFIGYPIWFGTYAMPSAPLAAEVLALPQRPSRRLCQRPTSNKAMACVRQESKLLRKNSSAS